MEYKDYYKILNINKSSSQEDIKKAYRNLAKKYHPDLNPGDESAQEKFKEINEAYEVLGDKEKKKKYDMFGSNYDFSGGQHFDPSQYGFGNGHSYTYTTTGGQDFSDFFNMFFGGDSKGFNINDLFGGSSSQRMGRSNRHSPRKQSFESELSISLEEGYRGTSKNINLSVGGENKEIIVKVPKGILPGQKLRVKGEKWGIDGDILFKINFIPDGNNELEGLDIVSKVDILPWEAGLGSKILVNTFDGRIRVTIPEGFVGGNKIRIAKKGYKDMKNQEGDLYIQINIVNPPVLSKEEKKLYAKLSKISKGNPRE